MSFVFRGLDPNKFRHLFGLPAEQLSRHGAQRMQVTENPGFPDRVSLQDVEMGSHVLLLNYEHLAVDTPYRSRHAIFVREGAGNAAEFENEVPPVIRRRLISLRAFDAKGMMLEADVAEGTCIEPLIARFFANAEVSYLHAHFAKRGCYAAQITRLN